MILFITRKHPPSVGGMQKLSYQLTTEIGKLTEAFVISWRRSQILLPFFLLYAFLKAVVMILKERIELVHLGDPVLSPLGLILKFAFRLPIVVNVHGLDITFRNRFYQFVVPKCLRQMDKLICISAQTREECLKRGISAEQCVIIPIGIEVDDYRPSLQEKRKIEVLIGKSTDDIKILLTVGRLVKRKGVASFIAQVLPQIIQAHLDIHYLVVGEGPERCPIEAQVRVLGLEDKVSVLGRVDDRTLKAIYHLSDIFIMPNIPVESDFEGFGVVALEACAAGLCVVASELEGIQDAVIHGQNGFLVSPYDIDSYVEIILNLLEDEQKRKHCGNRARDFVLRNYNWEKVSHQYLKVFKQVIAEQNRARKIDSNRSSGCNYSQAGTDETADADEWELSYLGTRRKLEVREKRIKLFSIDPAKKILDYGCGDGLDLRVFHNLGYSDVIGLDRSEKLLRQAKGFNVVLADGYATQFPAASFDVVFVDSVFHHLDFRKALTEINRILKLEGELCYIEPRNSFFRKVLDFVTFSPLAFLSETLSHRRITLTQEYDLQYAWLRNEKAMHKILRQTGFQIVTYKRDMINMFVKCRKTRDLNFAAGDYCENCH